MSDYADLIRQLQDLAATKSSRRSEDEIDEALAEAADVLAALVKERDERQVRVDANNKAYDDLMEMLKNPEPPTEHLRNLMANYEKLFPYDYARGLRDGKRQGLEEAASILQVDLDKARKQLGHAKKRAANWAMLEAVGYQGDPQADYEEIKATCELLEEQIASIRSLITTGEQSDA